MIIREKENNYRREPNNYLTSKMCKMGKTAKLPDKEVQQKNHNFLNNNNIKFISQVMSGKSHPDQLLILHPTQLVQIQHVGHYITTFDFHFLSHYSYIKSNHWTHLLVTCIPYVQDSARQCKIVTDSARQCKIVRDSARQCKKVQDNARMCKIV